MLNCSIFVIALLYCSSAGSFTISFILSTFPKKMNTERAHELIELIGKDLIKQVYELTKGEPVSFAMLVKVIRNDELEKVCIPGICFKEVAISYKVSAMTIYRYYHANVNNLIQIKKLLHIIVFLCIRYFIN
jgi:hypothetical protein